VLSTFLRDAVENRSKCPLASWLHDIGAVAEEHGRCASDQRARIIVIGGNKGYDCVGWTRMFSRRDSSTARAWPSAASWRVSLGEADAMMLSTNKTACGACMQCLADYPRPIAAAGLHNELTPHVDCVEALPINARLLSAAHATSPMWGAAGLRIVHAAATHSAKDTATVLFPSGDELTAGQEDIGIISEAGGSATLAVPALTIDQLVFGGSAHFPDPLIPDVPTVLTVDTEGHDPLVLQGAARTLATGRVAYVEFEYHGKGAWLNHSLREVVADMDDFGFDCYWAGVARVYKITGCWHPEYEIRRWSNIVCAHRGHVCWHGALDRAQARVGQPRTGSKAEKASRPVG
jgi:hypothetical protein